MDGFCLGPPPHPTLGTLAWEACTEGAASCPLRAIVKGSVGSPTTMNHPQLSHTGKNQSSSGKKDTLQLSFSVHMQGKTLSDKMTSYLESTSNQCLYFKFVSIFQDLDDAQGSWSLCLWSSLSLQNKKVVGTWSQVLGLFYGELTAIFSVSFFCIFISSFLVLHFLPQSKRHWPVLNWRLFQAAAVPSPWYNWNRLLQTSLDLDWRSMLVLKMYW